jgi:beta-glucanase (GH16 family)
MRTGPGRGHTPEFPRRASRLGLLVPAILAVMLAASSVASARTPYTFFGAGSMPARAKASSSKDLPIQPLGMRGTWKLILNSDFTGRKLNSSLWQPGWFGTGTTGPINGNELACYSPANVSLPGDHTLHLKVTAVPSSCQGEQRPYTGAVLSTNPFDGRSSGGFEYTYGALEARVYVPRSGSVIADWPAVIALGRVWPQDGEDDVLENLEGTVCSHFHSPGYAPGGPLGGCDKFLKPGWHTVSSDWEPGSVTWYYDGAEIAHITQGVTSAPMYLVLVNTVSSKAEPGVSRPDAMRVAYVRVWQHPTPPAA